MVSSKYRYKYCFINGAHRLGGRISRPCPERNPCVGCLFNFWGNFDLNTSSGLLVASHSTSRRGGSTSLGGGSIPQCGVSTSLGGGSTSLGGVLFLG